VLAEGVESATQVEFLRERGCRVAQGYLYSRPVDAGRLTELLERQTGSAAAAQGAESAGAARSSAVMTTK
jgi:sensor c-di-GMP phosphodiesterase-like protein